MMVTDYRGTVQPETLLYRWRCNGGSTIFGPCSMSQYPEVRRTIMSGGRAEHSQFHENFESRRGESGNHATHRPAHVWVLQP
jgi:hypothetical protein